MQFIMKHLSTLVFSMMSTGLAADICIITLRRLAAKTKNTLDDEIVEAIAVRLNVK